MACKCTEDGKGGKDEKPKKFITLDSINQNIVKAKFLCGALFERADELQKELDEGKTLCFDEIIKANTDDGQSMGQKPITYIRQVVAIATCPTLCCQPNFPTDAKSQAMAIIRSTTSQSLGSFADFRGISVVRQHIAEYIEDRDGIPANVDDIFIVSGITSITDLLASSDKKKGIMIPYPQFPLHGSTISCSGMEIIKYYLDECKGWAFDIEEMKKAITEAKNNNIEPCGILIISPGNPTGQVLTKETIQDIIKFANEQSLMILADEVYQHNIHDKSLQFLSFKKVMKEMGPPYDQSELCSFMSISKGWYGESGFRGGYMELVNADPDVKGVLLKLLANRLACATPGQAVLDCIVKPPSKESESFGQFCSEIQAISSSNAERAKFVEEQLNCLKGFKCHPIQGGTYAFPSICLAKKAVEEAKKRCQEPDFFYASELLKNTGILVVPGSEFGQKEGTYHIAISILPPMDKLKSLFEKFNEFNNDFTSKYW
ncbi:alanine aminotransferase 1-like [Ctenocephalides felis]|uniref:alanine aminotransferase 1-like n=1 Tax=Ctenocephalides felis TaxID=7515 RepID=UPI000E6E2212|nr:alanine aminotransferase 1-like [Ctenocephalides felis]